MFAPGEREYVTSARIGRLATADGEGRPHVVPVCFAVEEDRIVSAIDEKPQDVGAKSLRRVRNIETNPRVALVVDHYIEAWSDLGWVQVRGTAEILDPGDAGHEAAVSALREKYDQYEDHDLESRPVIRIVPGSVVSWGRLEQSEGGRT